MKILMGTKNPGKIQGAKEAFLKYYQEVEIQGIPVESNVSEEPVNEEIYQGAKNRVQNLVTYAKENNIEADQYIAIESGITNQLGKWIIINIAVIQTKEGMETWGTSSGFPVPEKYVEEIINTDLGMLMDKIFSQTELSKGKGGINFLTRDEISRIDLTREAFIMALTQIINGETWR